MHRRDVLDSFITYRDTGTGPVTVFLHGNPTSSYLWRNVTPLVEGRRLAPDLIGMGSSGKPDIGYRFVDHARYLDAWFEKLGLREVILVGHDWGGVLALDWAARHPERVRGVVLLETFLRPSKWSEMPPQGAEFFRALRTPGVGEKLVLEQNGFLPRSLGNGVLRGLTEAERREYEAPYLEPSSRRPMLQWPREISLDGQPADVTEIVERNAAWLKTNAVPTLLLTFERPGLVVSPAVVEWAKANVAGLEVVGLGQAGHHAPEDVPTEIGRAIADWSKRHFGR
jgi:haloalkane dehalogenase